MSVVYAFVQRAAYFGLYDTGKEYLFKDKAKTNFFAMWGFAQFTTIFANIVGYPLDTIRRRLMMQSGRDDILYRNALDCVRKIYQKEGASAFFKGQWTNIIR